MYINVGIFGLVEKLAMRGDVYVATTRYESVANLNKISLLIKNPIGSNKKQKDCNFLYYR